MYTTWTRSVVLYLTIYIYICYLTQNLLYNRIRIMTLLYPSHHIVYISNVYTCNSTNFSFLAILRKIFSFTTLLSHGELGTTEPKLPQILAVLETAPHLEALGVPDCHFWCSVSQYCRLIFFFFFLITILAYWRCLMIVRQRRTYCTGSS